MASKHQDLLPFNENSNILKKIAALCEHGNTPYRFSVDNCPPNGLLHGVLTALTPLNRIILKSNLSCHALPYLSDHNSKAKRSSKGSLFFGKSGKIAVKVDGQKKNGFSLKRWKPCYHWSRWADSNRRPTDYESI